MNTTYLEKPLPQLGQELDPLGPEFEELSKHIAHAEYVEAASAAEALWASGVYDARLLGYYLFGIFVERGVPSLTLMLDCILTQLRDSWDFLMPAERKEKSVDTSLRWVFNHVLHHLEHYKRIKDPRMARWSGAEYKPAHDIAFQRSAELENLLRTQVPDGRSLRVLQHLRATIDEMRRPSTESTGFTASAEEAIRQQEEQRKKVMMEDPESPGDDDEDAGDSDESDESSESKRSASADSHGEDGDDDDKKDDDDKRDEGDDKESDDGDEKSDDDDDEPDDESGDDDAASQKTGGFASQRSDAEVKSGATASARAAVAATGAETLTIPLTPALRMLIRKIDALGVLCEKKRHKAAATLVRDLQAGLSGFDPRRYLPSVLSGYFMLLVRHQKALAPHLAAPAASSDAVEAALTQLLETDLEAFMAVAEELK